MNWTDDYTIEFDYEYTDALNQKVREKYGSSGPRNATHASALLFCLKKEWLKQRENAPEEEISDQTLLTWSGGLMFEDLVSEGEQQTASAYCWICNAVAKLPNKKPGEQERDTCNVCGNRWLVFTPDYIVDGIIHEVKETRKSRKQGPGGAPWWIDQLRTYYAFAKLAGWTTAPYARIVVKWLMGDYSRAKKGYRPTPPQSSLDAFKIIFNPERLDGWIVELKRRAGITEGKEMPMLNGMGGGDELSPQYAWECSSCMVGKLANCENYVWDENDRDITAIVKEGRDGD